MNNIANPNLTVLKKTVERLRTELRAAEDELSNALLEQFQQEKPVQLQVGDELLITSFWHDFYERYNVTEYDRRCYPVGSIQKIATLYYSLSENQVRGSIYENGMSVGIDYDFLLQMRLAYLKTNEHG